MSNSIEWKELYAVTVACNTWAKTLVGKRVVIHCDNMSMVHAVNNGASKIQNIMVLIRFLVMIAARNNFEYRLLHIEGKNNIEADLLSRQRMNTFKELFPRYNPNMTTPIEPIDIM